MRGWQGSVPGDVGVGYASFFFTRERLMGALVGYGGYGGYVWMYGGMSGRRWGVKGCGGRFLWGEGDRGAGTYYRRAPRSFNERLYHNNKWYFCW